MYVCTYVCIHYIPIHTDLYRHTSIQTLLSIQYTRTVDPRVTTGLTYEQLGLRSKSFSFDLRPNIELRPACLSRPLELRAQIRVFVVIIPVSVVLYIRHVKHAALCKHTCGPLQAHLRPFASTPAALCKYTCGPLQAHLRPFASTPAALCKHT
jgi:hypothetical protein